MKQAHIYALICPSCNDIRYIGKTVTSLKNRLNKHLSDLTVAIRDDKVKNHRLRWMRKIKKSGLINKLKIISLEECKQNEASKREVYWIKLYRDKGYKLTNMSAGGSADFIFFTINHKNNISGGLKEYYKNNPKKRGKDQHASKPLIVKNIDDNSIEEFESICLCADDFNIPDKLIAYFIRFKRIWGNRIFIHKSKYGNIDLKKYKKYKGNPENYIPIIAEDINTGKAITFKSCSHCGRHFGVSKSTIWKYYHEKIIHLGWIFHHGNFDIKKYRHPITESSNSEKITLYDSRDNSEITFNSNAICSKHLGISKSALCKAIKRGSGIKYLYRDRYKFKIT